MRNINAFIVILVYLMNFNEFASAQASRNEVVVGRQFPDFIIKNIVYFSKRSANRKDFFGKALILDFWTSSCAGCIKSFPHLNALQKELGNGAQFMLVGYDDPSIRKLYSRLYRKLNLSIPSAFDTIFYKQFSGRNIIINKDGVVAGIVDLTEKTTAKNIVNILENKPAEIRNFRTLDEVDTNRISERIKYLDLYKEDVRDTGKIYQAALERWHIGMPISGPGEDRRIIQTAKKSGVLKVFKLTLSDLYDMAYFGRFHYINPRLDSSLYGKIVLRPILEVKDSSDFQFDYETEKGLFNFFLKSSSFKDNETDICTFLRVELGNIFRYKAEFEVRRMPYLRLILQDRAVDKLSTKGGEKTIEADNSHYRFRNVPMKELVLTIASSVIEDHQELSVCDETGISGNIDITLNSSSLFFEDFLRSLRENGLDLVIGFKDMKVVVIREPL